MKPLVTAILGYGLGGRVFHRPLLSSHPSFRIKYITGSAYTGPEQGTVDQVFADPEVELVVITTPNATHGLLVRRSLEAGKHAVVDKPFCLSSSEAQELAELAQKKGLVLTVFQNRRWDGDFLTLKKLLDQGRLGRVVQLESNFHRYRLGIRDSWKESQSQGGGILWDLGPHLLDQAMVLFGPPQAWRGDFRLTRPGGDTWDDYEITLDYGPGMRVLLKAAMVRAWPGPRFQIHGTAGSWVKFGMDPQEEALKSGLLTGEGWGREDPSRYGILHFQNEKGLPVQEPVPTESGNYGIFYDKLFSAVRFGGEVPVDPRENGLILRILEDLSREKVAGIPPGV